MDGSFDYKGSKISFQITDDQTSGVYMLNGVEKMSRYINFYDSCGNNVGAKRIYGNVEEMQNITIQQASLWYEEMCNGKEG